MELILLENVQNLGNLGDKVTVKPGYGRNFLVPQGKAVPATGENLKMFEERRAELEAKAAERKSAAEQRQAAIHEKAVTIHAKSSSEGKLYGSVGPREIAQAMQDAGLDVDKSEILMPEGPIRQAGEYQIDLQLYADVDATISLVVIGDEEA